MDGAQRRDKELVDGLRDALRSFGASVEEDAGIFGWRMSDGEHAVWLTASINDGVLSVRATLKESPSSPDLDEALQFNVSALHRQLVEVLVPDSGRLVLLSKVWLPDDSIETIKRHLYYASEEIFLEHKGRGEPAAD